MSTDLLMDAGIAITLAAIAAGYGLSILVERRCQQRRLDSLRPLRRVAGDRR